MSGKTTLDLCDIVSDLRGHNKLLKANEKGLRATNAELAGQLRQAQETAKQWQRLERVAREDVTRGQERLEKALRHADELSREAAQLRVDLRAQQEQCASLRHELENAHVAVAPRPQKPGARGPVCEPCGTLMVRGSTGGYRCLNCDATAPAEDPAICTLADLQPGQIAEALDDLRNGDGAIIIERGTRITSGGMEINGLKVSIDGLPVGYVMPTGRVRRTGETWPPAAQEEHQPPRRSPDAYTPPGPPRKGA